MNDKEILALFEARDPDAVAQVRQKYDPLCRSIAGKLLQREEDTEECLADTHLALWNTIPPEKPHPLSAYIARICRNIALKKWEQLSAQKRGMAVTCSYEELNGCIPGGVSPEDILEEKELAAAIRDFLQTQSKHQRIIFLRRYFFFDSPEEIAAALGIPLAAVYNSLSRTRQKLKSYLVKEGWINER